MIFSLREQAKEKVHEDDISDQYFFLIYFFFVVYKRSGDILLFSFIALFPYASKWLCDLATWVE